MCGRYTLIRLADFTDMFPWIRPPATTPPARYNIAPTQPVLAVANDGKNQLDYFRWGLVPSWAKDVSIGSRLINCRVETIAQKPAFRSAFKRRRCLIPASGFYEWQTAAGSGGKTPMYIRLKSGRPFAFAGLWEIWRAPDGSELPTCTIITGQPNSLVASIHNRMAMILPPEKYEAWIGPETDDVDQLLDLLEPFSADEMMAYPVSKSVNSPRSDGPELIEPRLEPTAVSGDTPKASPAKLRRRSGGDDQPLLF